MTLRRWRRYRGISLIWVALMGVIMTGLMGLAIDTSYCLWAAHRLQIAADASAMAGAQYVSGNITGARQAALTIAQANTVAGQALLLDSNNGNAATGDVVVGVFDTSKGTFTPTVSSPNAVEVNARRTSSSLGGALGLFFGPAFGVQTINLTRSAIAISAGSQMPGLLLLDSNASAALSATNGTTINVTGTIYVNSSNSQAVKTSGVMHINSTAIDVVGGVSGGPTVSGTLKTGATAFADPFASLPAPTWNPAADKGKVQGSGSQVFNLQPGYYSGGIQASGSTVINMAPGIYVLGGTGIDISNQVSINATGGVFIYITGNGAVNLTGQGVVNITAPTSANTFAGDFDIRRHRHLPGQGRHQARPVDRQCEPEHPGNTLPARRRPHPDRQRGQSRWRGHRRRTFADRQHQRQHREFGLGLSVQVLAGPVTGGPSAPTEPRKRPLVRTTVRTRGL